MKLLKKGNNSKAIEKYEAERKATKNAREEMADVNHLNTSITFMDAFNDSFNSVVSEISAPPSMRESFYKQNMADLDFTESSKGSSLGRRNDDVEDDDDADDGGMSLHSGDGDLSRSGDSAVAVTKEKASKKKKKKKLRIKKLFGSRHSKHSKHANEAIEEGAEGEEDDEEEGEEFYCDTSDDEFDLLEPGDEGEISLAGGNGRRDKLKKSASKNSTTSFACSDYSGDDVVSRKSYSGDDLSNDSGGGGRRLRGGKKKKSNKKSGSDDEGLDQKSGHKGGEGKPISKDQRRRRRRASLGGMFGGSTHSGDSGDFVDDIEPEQGRPAPEDMPSGSRHRTRRRNSLFGGGGGGGNKDRSPTRDGDKPIRRRRNSMFGSGGGGEVAPDRSPTHGGGEKGMGSESNHKANPNRRRRNSLFGGTTSKASGMDQPKDVQLLINNERMARGMAPFTVDLTLNMIAQGIAQDMANNVQLTPCEFFGNLGRGKKIYEVHESIMEDRKGISRKNILSEKFTEFGTGVARGNGKYQHKFYICTLFR